MRRAEIHVDNILAARLEEQEKNASYLLRYVEEYDGPPVSQTMPVSRRIYEFDQFPSFFDGLLPEGPLLEALLRTRKLDKDDYFAQLVAVGEDVVGNVTIKEVA